mmetsp:Transcript_13938/g.24407  ORF Transcript_13938/g.24407 Transcript_13938/m.24407 type:complete len:115 (+) Transcript_13938:322-666(+)
MYPGTLSTAVAYIQCEESPKRSVREYIAAKKIAAKYNVKLFVLGLRVKAQITMGRQTVGAPPVPMMEETGNSLRTSLPAASSGSHSKTQQVPKMVVRWWTIVFGLGSSFKSSQR